MLARPAFALARSAARTPAAPRLSRAMHIENTVGNNMPFQYRGPTQTKGKVAFKVTAFFVTGFSIPFFIARYQMKKSGAI